MADARVDICNRGLGRLGAAQIASFNEPSNEAFQCRQFYDPDREEVLQSHPWNFATSTQELSQTANTPPDYNYEYALPTDCLHVLEIVSSEVAEPIGFEVREDRTLVCDEQEVTIKYIKNVTDPSKFSKLFISALTYRLAADLAMPLTGNIAYQQSNMQMYNAMVIPAQGSDAREGKKDETSWIGQSLIDARS